MKYILFSVFSSTLTIKSLSCYFSTDLLMESNQVLVFSSFTLMMMFYLLPKKELMVVSFFCFISLVFLFLFSLAVNNFIAEVHLFFLMTGASLSFFSFFVEMLGPLMNEI